MLGDPLPIEHQNVVNVPVRFQCGDHPRFDAVDKLFWTVEELTPLRRPRNKVLSKLLLHKIVHIALRVVCDRSQLSASDLLGLEFSASRQAKRNHSVYES